MSTMETQVLIAGAGPVGLSLAVDLGWRGVCCLLVEQEGPDARATHPRMDNVGIRTMEFARRWGLVTPIEQAGFPRDLPMSVVYATGVLGYELARDTGPANADAKPPPFSPQRHELCPQNYFDPVLQAAAASYSENRLLYRHRLANFEDRGDHIEAMIQSVEGGPSLTVRAQYLAGCDGAGSTVAQHFDQPPLMNRLLSCSTNIFIRCAELSERTSPCRAYRYILVGPEGVWGSFVNINGRDIWRLQLLGDQRWPTWTQDEIASHVRRGIGVDIPFEVLSWVPWARREIVAGRFRQGRSFLVGDAAHQLSPTGGYGMNTGIAEAVDLSWKLAATLAGWGGEALLDSYEIERRPQAVRNVRQGSENLAAMRSIPPEPRLLEPSDAGSAARATIGALTQSSMQREWRSFGIHLGGIYRDSPIVANEDTNPPEDDIANFQQRANPGARAPHVWLEPGLSTLDLFGRGFVLLSFASDADADIAPLLDAARKIGLPLTHHAITDAKAAALYERRYVLVRPDGHIAWRGDQPPPDPHGLIDLVRGAAPSEAGKSKGAPHVFSQA